MIDEISGDFLQWLRGFYFVAEQGSVRQAGIAMGREQPTISRQIRCLEKELRVMLFDRSLGKMRITPEGKVLQNEATSLFEDIKRIKSELRDRKQDYEGKIFIATPHAIIDTILPSYIRQFNKLHPRVSFHLEGAIHEEVYEKVESGEADFGIAVCDTVPKTLTSYNMFESGLVLIAPKNNPFSLGKSPTLGQIAKAPLILSTHGRSVELLLEGPFTEKHLRPNVVMTHNNYTSMKKYVALGMGAAILGSHAVSREDEKVFDIFSLDHYFPTRNHLILLKKNGYVSPLLRSFLSMIKPGIQLARQNRTVKA